MPTCLFRIGAFRAGGALAVCLNLVVSAAVLSQPGPEQFGPEVDGLAPLSEVLVLETPAIDVAVASARAASAASVVGGGPVPFAEPFAVDVMTSSHGRWESSSDGRTAVWRLRVISNGARSLNLGFGRYRMPPGGRLRVYTPAGDEIAGPYTAADNRPHGELWTPILSGGDVVIEVAVPVERVGELELRLGAVNRGFRDPVSVRSPAHASCHIDVACSAGDAYRDQIRSVGLYTVYGTWTCTGALLNNATQDSRPFLLTARHCFGSMASQQVPSVVVYWNYQRPACGVGTAHRRDSQSGAVLRVEDRETDLVLLELDDEPDPTHKLYLAGWDLGSAAPTSAVTIHHPEYHHKSISVEDDPLTRARYGSASRHASYWRVADWDSGSVEPGTSGAPLFDQNKRVVGAIRGAYARCGNDLSTWAGALTALASRLSEWLDPDDTGATFLDGMNPNHRPRSLRPLDDKAVQLPAADTPAAALSVDLSPFFRDPDGDALTYAATSSDEQAVTVSISGSSVSLTPVAAGSSTITVKATDTSGSNKEASSMFQVTVGTNRSPEPSGTLADQSLVEGDTARVDLTSAFTDADNDTLTLAASSTDTSVARVALSGTTVTVTAVNGPGTATVDVTATDAGGSNTKARHRFDVQVRARRGVIVSPGTLTVHEGSQESYAVQLDSEPTGEVTIRPRVVSSSKVTVYPRGLTFDDVNWETAQRIVVEAVDDADAVSEQATVRHDVSGSDYGSVTAPSVTVTVLDDEAPQVTARFASSSYDVTEGQSVEVVVQLDRDAERDVEVLVNRAHPGGAEDADYEGVPASVVFGPGVTSRSFQVTATDDAEDDDGEAVELTLSATAWRVTADGRTTIAILDNDGGGGGPPPGGGGPPPPDPDPDPDPEPPPPQPPPTVSVSAAEARESDGAVVFDVRLSRTSSSAVTVDYATADGAGAGGAKAGSDYTATAGTLTFAAGSRAERIRVPVTDDGQYEAASETFALTLRRPRNATLSGGVSVLRVLGTIHDDDDGPPVAAFELLGATCDEELCRARTGAPVRFIDTSTGRVLSRHWEFGEGKTSRSRRVAHAWSSPGFHEVTLSVSDGATTSRASRVFLVEAAEPQGTCVADAETLCLQDSRYAVTVEWRKADGEVGAGRVVHEGTNDSGMFTFFSRENWEVLINVLDGCAVNGHVWVYGASTTDLGFTIQVTDTATGAVKEYANEPGTAAAAVTDATSFPDGCLSLR